MKIQHLLRQRGEMVWPFLRTANVKSAESARRRLYSAVARPPHQHVKVTSKTMVLFDPQTYTCEPVLLVKVEDKE